MRSFHSTQPRLTFCLVSSPGEASLSRPNVELVLAQIPAQKRLLRAAQTQLQRQVEASSSAPLHLEQRQNRNRRNNGNDGNDVCGGNAAAAGRGHDVDDDEEDENGDRAAAPDLVFLAHMEAFRENVARVRAVLRRVETLSRACSVLHDNVWRAVARVADAVPHFSCNHPYTGPTGQHKVVASLYVCVRVCAYVCVRLRVCSSTVFPIPLRLFAMLLPRRAESLLFPSVLTLTLYSRYVAPTVALQYFSAELDAACFLRLAETLSDTSEEVFATLTAARTALALSVARVEGLLFDLLAQHRLFAAFSPVVKTPLPVGAASPAPGSGATAAPANANGSEADSSSAAATATSTATAEAVAGLESLRAFLRGECGAWGPGQQPLSASPRLARALRRCIDVLFWFERQADADLLALPAGEGARAPESAESGHASSAPSSSSSSASSLSSSSPSATPAAASAPSMNASVLAAEEALQARLGAVRDAVEYFDLQQKLLLAHHQLLHQPQSQPQRQHPLSSSSAVYGNSGHDSSNNNNSHRPSASRSPLSPEQQHQQHQQLQSLRLTEDALAEQRAREVRERASFFRAMVRKWLTLLVDTLLRIGRVRTAAAKTPVLYALVSGQLHFNLCASCAPICSAVSLIF